MDITPQMARQELARRELVRRGVSATGSPSLSTPTPYPAGTGAPPTSEQLDVAKSTVTNALPTLGAIGGGLLGAAGGSVGGPAGTFAGGVAGAGAGGSAGEALKEKIQTGVLSPKEIAKTGGEFSALEAIGGPVASVAGKVTELVGSKVAQLFIPKTMAEAKMLQAYKAATPFIDRVKTFVSGGKSKAPATSGSAAFNQGLVGPESWLGVQAKRAQTNLWKNLIEPALKSAKGTTNIPKFFDQAAQKITKETNDPTRLNSLLKALDSVREDFKGVENISKIQLQKYKEGWAEFVPEKAYKGESIAGALNDVRDTLAGMARDDIYKAVGDNVKQAYLDYGSLHGITKLGQSAMTGPVKAGGTFTGIKDLLERIAIPAGTLGGQTIYKIGQGLEIFGAPGAKTIRAALGIPLGFGQETSTPYTPTQTATSASPVPPQI